MKRVVASYILKDYDVAIYPRGARGRMEDKMVQHWSLSATSVEKCKDFAQEIVEGMTLEEIFSLDLVYDHQIQKFQYWMNFIADEYDNPIDEPVGWDVATKAFSYDIVKE